MWVPRKAGSGLTHTLHGWPGARKLLLLPKLALSSKDLLQGFLWRSRSHCCLPASSASRTARIPSSLRWSWPLMT